MSEILNSQTVFDGPQVVLEDMMAAREKRSFRQKALLEKYQGQSLLCLTMNIPGPVKTSPALNQAFEEIVTDVRHQLNNDTVFDHLLMLDTGWEYYLVSSLPPEVLKRKMIATETAKPVGRLMDLDVLTLKDGFVQPISRRELGFPARQCYICHEDAKVCGRSRKHSIEDMRSAIVNLLKQS
ncbi:citrate lyase holo-[acyl-carrier protein] synthase [Streptococcus devriesei]|uniref:citrate lyase holo-[acyl-carrier protein] synthase n=1 Tax=Streptococcus devriesei TaxID=231233 RepID=UPI00040CA908|nr:citrate lyase holo-[acyl-carrier protein] synthase [Streptococcus devriesei]